MSRRVFSKRGDFRASERRAELVRVMPSAAENVKEICTNFSPYNLMATWSVALISTNPMMGAAACRF